MGRYIKEEDGKKVVYEEGFLLDRRVGKLEETSIFDFTTHDYILQKDNIFSSPEYVDEKKELGGLGDLFNFTGRPNDYEVTSSDGNTTTFEYDSWRNRHNEIVPETSENEYKNDAPSLDLRSTDGSASGSGIGSPAINTNYAGLAERSVPRSGPHHRVDHRVDHRKRHVVRHR